MDTSKIIAELLAKGARIDEAIVSLEQLPLMGTPPGGRPLAWSRATNLTAPQGRNGQNGLTRGLASFALPRLESRRRLTTPSIGSRAAALFPVAPASCGLWIR
jgi:hypothetical protein